MERPTLPDSHVVASAEPVWGSALQPAGCQACGQAHLVEAAAVGQVCPNCVRGVLAAQPARLRPEPPELMLRPRKAPADLRAIFTGYLKGMWLRPDELNVERLLKRARLVYWPMWLVDATVIGGWQGEVGFNYEVESSQEAYQGGAWQTRKIVETRVRWEGRAGQIARRYDNVAAPALSDQARLLSLAGEYETTSARAYDQTQAAGAAVRVPDLAPDAAWPLAETNLKKQAAQDCRAACGADHMRNYAVDAVYESPHWTQLLLPMYVTYYGDDAGQRHPLYVNGQSGRIGGARLASQRKGWLWAAGFVAVAAAVFVLALFSFAVALLIPPVAVLGIVLGVGALAVALAAIVPVVWPWQWNRRQQTHKVVAR